MSAGMNVKEAEEIAKEMTYRDAVNNALRGRCIPYKKATRIKLKELLELVERKGDKKHVKMLRQIKGHNNVESLQIMLEVIEVLEKNLAHDDRVNIEDWLVLFAWLEEYYIELKEMFIKERKAKANEERKLDSDIRNYLKGKYEEKE